ncbi:MAG: twin-arginine translocation signal domain-containing protein [Chromatiales bacterium]|nr:twin-arginine translocation signal domain-containing protein [Chromatiales bacterium]
MSRDTISRREFLAGSAAVGVTLLLPGRLSAAADGKKTFTILHTNDMHSSFIGMGPAADYTPFTLNDDTTRGGYARLAGLDREAEGSAQGPGSGAGAGRGRLQHGDRVRRRHPRDRRRTAAHGPDGLRRHHLRQP